MADGQSEPSSRTELISSLEELAVLAEELRHADDMSAPVLIAEVDELLTHARKTVDRLAAQFAVPNMDTVQAAGSREGGIDGLTIAYTVGITTLVLPFLQGIAQRASEDAYRAITAVIQRRRSARRPSQDPHRIVLSDRETKAQIIIDENVDGAALAKLQQIDFADENLREATLRWAPERQTWEVEPRRPPVNLWLPGDPLDEDEVHNTPLTRGEPAPGGG
ncbi:hypothetical protein [Streptomyces sp. NPDC001530]|uniref:hypothetical protein n=1 Tax=Streptomyces sp. NPDC001530 TaxID=3364582 RepID=UPI0036A09AD2